VHGAHDQFGDFDDDLDMNDETSAPAPVRSLLCSIAHYPLAYPLSTPTLHDLGGAKRRSLKFQALPLGLCAVLPTTFSPSTPLYCFGYMLPSYT
jgi:hypothetical protein